MGVDRHAATRQGALTDGVVDVVTDNLTSGLKAADLVILAAPVRSILTILAELPQIRPDGCLVMDLGSTKEEICTAMSTLPESFAAIGGHPMCGKETAGYHAADAELFRGQTFILSRNDRTTSPIERWHFHSLIALEQSLCSFRLMNMTNSWLLPAICLT